MALLTRAQQEAEEKLKNPEDIKKAIAVTGKAESTVTLYRENVDRLNSYDFLTTMAVSSFDQGMIQKRYGGGQYRAKFFNENNDEIRTLEFGIVAIPREKESDDTLERILKAIENNRDRGRDSQQPDIGLTVLLPLILKMMERDPMKEVVALMSVLREGNDGSGTNPLEIYAQMQKERDSGIALGKTMGILEAGGNTDTSLVKEAITQFAPAAIAIAQGFANKNSPTPALGVPVIPVTPQITPPQFPENLLWLVPLRQYLPILLKKAKEKKNAVVYAAVLLEEISDDMREKLAVSSRDSNFVDMVIGGIPEFQQSDTQLWAREFLTEIQAHFLEDEPISIEEAEKAQAEDMIKEEALRKLQEKKEGV